MPTSYEWLQRFLTQEPSQADVRALVGDCPREDDFVEYKAAAWVQEPDAKSELREYVAAFANVAGGIVVLGYDRARCTFEGVKDRGKTPIEDWISETTTPLRAYFHTPPRFPIVEMAEGPVAVLVIPRSPNLVAIREGNATRYPVRWGATKQQLPRIHDLPEDLALDILVGRRRNPFLRVAIKRVEYTGLHRPGHPVFEAPGVFAIGIEVHLQIENAGLVFAESTRVGVVGWVARRKGSPAVAPSLLEAVDAAQPVSTFWPVPWELQHFRSGRGGDISPFEMMGATIGLEELPTFWASQDPGNVDPMLRGEASGRVRWHAAIYVLPQSGEPAWFQLIVDYERAITLGGRGELRQWSVEPVAGRPRVAVTFRPSP